MSKERLEAIKSQQNIKHLNNNIVAQHVVYPFITLTLSDYKWLIEQAEQVQYYEFQSERKTHALVKIIDTLNEDYYENWEQAIEIAHEHKKDYVRGKNLSSDLKIRTIKQRLIEQNNNYLMTISAMQQILKEARISLDCGEKVQGLEYGIGMADEVLRSELSE